MLFFVILGLLIWLGVEVYRYFKVKANAFSKDEVIKAADKQARKLEYRDPVITCDYCGAKIDTRKHKVCPQCGGPYDKDEEWISRHIAEDQFINKNTEDVIAQREEKAQKESKEILKKIKKLIIALSVIIGGLTIFGTVGLIMSTRPDYRKSEDPCKDDYDNYVLADYGVADGGVIYDDGKITISVADFYLEDSPYTFGDGILRGDVKVGIRIQNNTDGDISVYLVCNAINGLSSETCKLSFYDTFKKGCDVTIYEKVYNVPNQKISQLVFGELKVYTKNYQNNVEVTDGLIVKTTCEQWDTMDLSDKTLIFSNDSVDMYMSIEENAYENGPVIYAVNKTDKGFTMTSSDLKIDGKTVYLYGFNDVYLPAGYTFKSDILSSYDEAYTSRTNDNSVTLNISFVCSEDPTMDFSTGYLEVNQGMY